MNVRRSLLPAVLISAVAATACHPLEFVSDRRLHFTAPAARSTVDHLPLTVRWRMADFTTSGLTGSTSHDAGEFAVFVDGTPIKVGQTVAAVSDGDPACEQDPTCPSPSYLRDRGVYLTTNPYVVLKTFPSDGGHTHVHTVSVVLLDGTGHRFSESSWLLSFKLAKDVPAQ